MINKNNQSQPLLSNLFIDLWSLFYLFMVYAFTMIFDEANIIVFAIYFICAIPFVFFLDKFLCICFILSTMSYFFLGGDEGIWSLYTILAMIMLLRMFLLPKNSLQVKSVLCLVWVVSAVIVSYLYSKYAYSMGMFAMLYNIVVAFLVSVTVKLNWQTVTSFLPRITSLQIIAYVVLLLIGGHYDGYGYSVSEDINHNTFGASVAVLSMIIVIKIMFYKGNLVYKFIWILSLVLLMLSGSRNALMALIILAVIVFMIAKKHRGKTISGGFKLLLISSALVLFGGILLTRIGIDLSRYDYVDLISTGGSNRTVIWEVLSRVIFRDYKWFGYGPGHFCSEQMLASLINQDYKHTHNTVFEAWGELGFFGLIPFVLILIFAFRNGYNHIKKENTNLMIGFLFIGVLVLGLGESFFVNIELWILIGLLLSVRKTKKSPEIDRSKNDKE